MSDLISRQAVYDILRFECSSAVENYLRQKVEKIPSAYTKKWKWIRDEFGSKCGHCGLYAYRDKFDRPWESSYCPNCGARMDG